MSRHRAVVSIVWVICVLALTASEESGDGRGHALQRISARAMLFESNQGQAPGDVRFLWRSNRGALYLKPGAIEMSWQPVAGQSTSRHIRTSFVGSRSDVDIAGESRHAQRTNYIRPTATITGVPNFQRVRYADLYPGVDLVVYGAGGQLEYDFIVQPGGDAGAIRMRTAGADKVFVDEQGELVITVGAGEMRHRRPYVYQEDLGKQVRVDGHFVVVDGDVSFSLGAYDRSKPLFIDPVLAFSTYLGSSQYDGASGVVTNAKGDSYIAGLTYTDGFPGTEQGFQSTLRGNSDTYVAKVSTDGSEILVATYFGGTGDDYARDLALGPDGTIYVTGITTSPDLPIRNAAQAVPTQPWTWDVFVAKLSPGLDDLLYSTYIGGNAEDTVADIAVDAAGVAYVAGTAGSPDFPVVNAAQPSLAGSYDAFVAAIPAGGGSFVYSTFYGSRAFDRAGAIAVRRDGTAFIVGTSDGSLRTTPGVLQPTRRGSSDAFVLELSPAGAVVYSTYLGGSGADQGTGVDVNGAGEVFVGGITASSDFPTLNAFQSTRRGKNDVFVSHVNASGSALLTSTYIGGADWDEATRLALSPSGNACVAGYTYSTNFPLASPLQSVNHGCSAASCVGGDGFDAFVSCIDPAGALAFSTYLGGDERDTVNDISIARDGAIYMTGQTISSNFPTTPGVFSRQPLGQFDGYLAKIVEAPRGDLALAKTGTWHAASHELRYALAVSNKGDTATGVTVTDRLPADTRLKSCDTGGTGTCGLTGDTVTVRYTSLPPGGSATASLVLTPSCAIPDRTKVLNQAHVESSSADGNQANNTAEAVVQVTNPPPAISALKSDHPMLWPPNHKMRDVRLSYVATDSCGAVSCTVQVTSSDRRASSADWLVLDAHHVRLRAERSGGRPRDYRIAVTCRDEAGGATTKTVSVVVPANEATAKR